MRLNTKWYTPVRFLPTFKKFYILSSLCGFPVVSKRDRVSLKSKKNPQEEGETELALGIQSFVRTTLVSFWKKCYGFSYNRSIQNFSEFSGKIPESNCFRNNKCRKSIVPQTVHFPQFFLW